MGDGGGGGGGGGGGVRNGAVAKAGVFSCRVKKRKETKTKEGKKRQDGWRDG